MSSDREKIMKSLSSRAKRVSKQIKNLNKSRLQYMKDILYNVLETKQEILKLISGKYSSFKRTKQNDRIQKTMELDPYKML